MMVELLDSASDEQLKDLREFVREASFQIRDKGRELCASSIGTTLTLLLASDGSMQIAQVGDSVAFILDPSSGFRQLTREQTLAQERILAGDKNVEAYLHHVLTQCMGQPEEVVPDVISLPLTEGSRIILCSDGITKTVADEHIEEVLRECESPAEVVKQLIDMANRAGGPDNSTVVTVFA